MKKGLYYGGQIFFTAKTFELLIIQVWIVVIIFHFNYKVI